MSSAGFRRPSRRTSLRSRPGPGQRRGTDPRKARHPVRELWQPGSAGLVPTFRLAPASLCLPAEHTHSQGCPSLRPAHSVRLALPVRATLPSGGGDAFLLAPAPRRRARRRFTWGLTDGYRIDREPREGGGRGFREGHLSCSGVTGLWLCSASNDLGGPS